MSICLKVCHSGREQNLFFLMVGMRTKWTGDFSGGIFGCIYSHFYKETQKDWPFLALSLILVLHMFPVSVAYK